LYDCCIDQEYRLCLFPYLIIIIINHNQVGHKLSLYGCSLPEPGTKPAYALVLARGAWITYKTSVATWVDFLRYNLLNSFVLALENINWPTANWITVGFIVVSYQKDTWYQVSQLPTRIKGYATYQLWIIKYSNKVVKFVTCYEKFLHVTPCVIID